MTKRKRPHRNATTTVEVYRLFNIGEAASALTQSADLVVRALGSQILRATTVMTEPYRTQQARLKGQPKLPKAWKGKLRKKRP